MVVETNVKKHYRSEIMDNWIHPEPPSEVGTAAAGFARCEMWGFTPDVVTHSYGFSVSNCRSWDHGIGFNELLGIENRSVLCCKGALERRLRFATYIL